MLRMFLMKGIIYCRVSSQEQVQGTSLHSQEEACLAFAKANHIEVVKVFIEKGESATAANRTELIKALDYCKEHKGEIGAFIVWKCDRFARSMVDHYGLQAQLIKFGTTLRSVTEPIDDSPIGKMTEAMLAGYAEFENEIRKQRCEGGMQKKIIEGIWPWWPPIGYAHSKTRLDRRKTRPDEPDPIRFHIIQRALKEYAKGGLSIQGLTNLMNDWGLRTRTNKPMFKQLVEKMLRDKFYAGILINPWDQTSHKGQHQPMITLEEYERIQFFKASYSRVQNVPRLRLNPDFPLRRFVVCPCGSKLTGSWHKGRSKRYAYYECHNIACEFRNQGIPIKVMERKFIKLLEKITPCEEFLDAFEATVIKYWESEGQVLKIASESYVKELNRLEEKKERLIQMRADKELSLEEFTKAKEAVENKIIGLKVSSNEVKTDEFNIQSDLEYAKLFLKDVARQWQDMNVDQQQRLQKRIFPNGIIYDRTKEIYRTAILSPIFRLSGQFSINSSDFVAGAGLEPAPRAYGARMVTLPPPRDMTAYYRRERA